jgi:hypothetical protein
MPISHKYTVVCDDIRREDNGKFIILGLYTPDVVVPTVPFGLPALCFFTVLESDTSGPFEFSFTLKQGDTILAGGSGKMNLPRPGLATVPLRLGSLLLPSAGSYTFTLSIAGAADITHEFSVNLAVQALGQPQAPLVH